MELSDETQQKLQKLIELGKEIPEDEALVMTLGISIAGLDEAHCDMCRAGLLQKMAWEAVTTMMHNYQVIREARNASRH